jgi:hypothetical protein
MNKSYEGKYSPDTIELVGELKKFATTTTPPSAYIAEQDELGSITIAFTQDMVVPPDLVPDDNLMTL